MKLGDRGGFLYRLNVSSFQKRGVEAILLFAAAGEDGACDKKDRDIRQQSDRAGRQPESPGNADGPRVLKNADGRDAGEHAGDRALRIAEPGEDAEVKGARKAEP